jgi:hypothetical protein
METVAVRPRVYVQAPVPKVADQREPEKFVRYTGVMLRSHVPWLHGWGVFGESSTAMPADVAALCRPRRIDGRWIPPRRVHDLAGVEYFVVSLEGARAAAIRAAFSDWSPDQKLGWYVGPVAVGEPLPLIEISLPGEELEPPVAVVIRNTSVVPRARIVHEGEFVPAATTIAERGPLLERIALPRADTPDLINRVLIEAPQNAVIAAAAVAGSSATAEIPLADAVRVVTDESRHVVLDADLVRPGLLVLADTFHADWRAAILTDGGLRRPIEIFRANGIHRAVSLPAGKWRVEFQHRSATFDRTFPITVAAWCLGVVAWTAAGRGPRREVRHHA